MNVAKAGGAPVILAAACLVWSLAGCGRDPAPEGGSLREDRPRQILLITLDTTRWDRLGCYGFRPEGLSPSPNLDALAAEGRRYERAYVSAPLTLPSHATMLTGLEPPEHGVRENEGFRLVPAEERPFRTLAEELGGAGYATAAFVSARTLDAAFGLDAGFDLYDDVSDRGGPGEAALGERSAAETTEAALRWLGEKPRGPAFLWVHYFDPHHPHVPHPGLSERFLAAGASLYEGEIAFMDRHLGRLLDAYREAGLWEDTLVVVLADHGEGLGEHGEDTHGLLVYDQTIRVPFIVKPHRGLASADLPRRSASALDLAPTLRELVGLPAGEGGGRGLLGADPGSAHYAETVFPFRQLGWSPLHSIREGDLKLVLGGGRAELFDTRADPYENRDLAADRPGETARLRDLLLRRRRALKSRIAGESRRRELGASSYIQAVADDVPAEPPDDVAAGLPDPRSRTEVVRVLDRLRLELDRLEGRGADARLAAFIAAGSLRERLDALARPDNPAAAFWSGRAALLLALRRGEEAWPDAFRAESLELALERFARFRALRPRDPRGYDLSHRARLVLHEIGGDPAQLETLDREVEGQIGLGLETGLARALRAAARARRGLLEEAVSDLERAVALEPGREAFRRDLERVRARRDEAPR